jgi:hypothetical protein
MYINAFGFHTRKAGFLLDIHNYPILKQVYSIYIYYLHYMAAITYNMLTREMSFVTLIFAGIFRPRLRFNLYLSFQAPHPPDSKENCLPTLHL